MRTKLCEAKRAMDWFQRKSGDLKDLAAKYVGFLKIVPSTGRVTIFHWNSSGCPKLWPALEVSSLALRQDSVR